MQNILILGWHPVAGALLEELAQTAEARGWSLAVAGAEALREAAAYRDRVRALTLEAGQTEARAKRIALAAVVLDFLGAELQAELAREAIPFGTNVLSSAAPQEATRAQDAAARAERVLVLGGLEGSDAARWLKAIALALDERRTLHGVHAASDALPA